jgi:hypothetical protein
MPASVILHGSTPDHSHAMAISSDPRRHREKSSKFRWSGVGTLQWITGKIPGFKYDRAAFAKTNPDMRAISLRGARVFQRTRR